MKIKDLVEKLGKDIDIADNAVSVFCSGVTEAKDEVYHYTLKPEALVHEFSEMQFNELALYAFEQRLLKIELGFIVRGTPDEVLLTIASNVHSAIGLSNTHNLVPVEGQLHRHLDMLFDDLAIHAHFESDINLSVQLVCNRLNEELSDTKEENFIAELQKNGF